MPLARPSAIALTPLLLAAAVAAAIGGKLGIPTCTRNADCPAGMGGQTLTCKNGVCAP